MDKNYLRLPEYLKRPIAKLDDTENKNVRQILSKYNLNTVCDSARCPNKTQCFGECTATFLIMGKICTRNCRFCNITSNTPKPLDKNEPENVANAVIEMGLKYAVITSTTRDDINDGGAEHFKLTIDAIRKKDSSIKTEILTPDFKGNKNSLDTIIKANPDVFNHNIETVPSLYETVRPEADYKRSLDVLSYVKKNSPNIITKTGIMTGLGETYEEIEETIKDIKNANLDILTLGQYIRPSKHHLEVKSYSGQEAFENLKKLAEKIGIKACISAPLARSSYMAFETYKKIREQNIVPI